MANPLAQLIQYGQSFWLDNIHREFTRAGKLQEMIDRDGLRGVTSNPTIFMKAVSESTTYDEAVREMHRARKSAEEMYDALTTEDVSEACDVFADLHRSSNAGDGFVSLELPPNLARDTQRSIDEGRRLWKLVGRPNLLVKVPATDEGIPVVRALISEGINVNITLMFGAEYYERVIDAYFSGLEDRLAGGLALGQTASVASCFVSRIDTEADKRIQEKMEYAGARSEGRLGALLGKAAIANSKRLYAVYKQSIETARWKKLSAAGARRQRPLWASTSTKNPEYPDTYYVEALIGPDTVDTMPPATIDAFRDHGKLANTLEQDMDQAEATLAELQSLGISIKDVTDKLLADGVVLFEKSYHELEACIEGKVQALKATA